MSDHKPDCASFDFDPEKQLGPDKACDCQEQQVFVTAMCQRAEHGECLSFICGCPCHD